MQSLSEVMGVEIPKITKDIQDAVAGIKVDQFSGPLKEFVVQLVQEANSINVLPPLEARVLQQLLRHKSQPQLTSDMAQMQAFRTHLQDMLRKLRFIQQRES